MIKLFSNKEVKNASWLIGGKVAQMMLSLVVSVITARYLGPGNFGLLGYGAAYVTFFTALCNLGINSIIIKNFVDHPEEQGEAIGTTIVLRAISSALSALLIVGLVSLIDRDESLTITVVALCSIALVFQIFDTINYWFQFRYQSKVTSIATLIAYVVVSAYKIVLLILGKDVRWFAFATSVDFMCIGLFLFLAYRRNSGPQLKFSMAKAKELLGSSYHYILSGLMVAIYGQTDKLMLKQMLSEVEVGYYSTAQAICNMWVFVLAAIIDSMYPTIMRLYQTDSPSFDRKNRQLYCIVFYLSMFVSLFFLFFGDLVIRILYGAEYAPASVPLKIITLYTAFSYLGVARNAWIVCKGTQSYLKYMYLSAAVINVALNFLLIPVMGVSGAALASLITQIFTSLILPLFFKPVRPNVKLILEAICFQKIK